MAVFSTRRTTFSFWISVFLLLLVFLQMLTALVKFAGVFILSNEAFVSPFRFCLTDQHGESSCRSHVNGAESGVKINILTTVVILCLYVPVVLVAFALLATMLAAYARDRTALWLSAGCQGASSLLILMGIVIFLLLNHSHVSWDHMTLSFYLCVAAQVELGVTAVLTYVL